MLAFTLSFLLGIATPTTWACLPPPWLSFILIPITLGIGIFWPLGYRNFVKPAIAFLLGIVWCCYRASHLPLDLPPTYFDKPILTSGYIVSVPEYQPNRLKFEYLIENINGKPSKPLRILLTQYDYQPPSLLEVQSGQYWQLAIRLKKPRGFWNPGSFDQQAWLLQRGIAAIGTLVIKDRASAKLVNNHRRFSLFHTAINRVHGWRLALGDYMQASVSTPRYLGLLQALVIGMRQKILPNQWEVMQATGTTHLFSISGLHIGFVSGIIYNLVRILWSCSSLLCLWVPKKQAAYFGAWVGALSYGVISGFALPIQRALIMFSISVLTLLRRRVLPGWQSWCTALIVMLFINPFIVLSASFWLSFGAMAVIFYGLGARLRINRELTVSQKLWRSWGSNQWIISIGLVPMGLWFFQQISIVGLMANLVAIPWVGFIVLPMSLLATLLHPIWPEGMSLLITLSDKALDCLWQFLSYVANLPLSHYFLVIPNRWILLSTSLCALLLIAPAGFPSRYYLAGISCLPLLLWRAPVPLPNEFWLTLLDVGQGLSAIVRTHKHILVYDTGPRFGEHNDAGNLIIVPYLRTLGVRKINTLIVSHGDSDHRGGAQSILKTQEVQRVLTSDLKRLNVKRACVCSQGQTWQWDGVTFSLLHPTNPHRLKGNDASCVLKVSNQIHQCLLPGDLHQRGERVLLANNPNLNTITTLVAPHHGSKTSSSIAFLARTLPKYVLFSVGYRNRFRFPHASIIQRYKDYKSKLYSTAEEGMVTVKFSSVDKPPTVESFYQKNRRFWHEIS